MQGSGSNIVSSRSKVCLPYALWQAVVILRLDRWHWCNNSQPVRKLEDNAGVIVNDKGEMKGSAIQAACTFSVASDRKVSSL